MIVLTVTIIPKNKGSKSAIIISIIYCFMSEAQKNHVTSTELMALSGFGNSQ